MDHRRIKVDLLHKKKISMSFYKIISWESINCHDHEKLLRNKNPCHQRNVYDYF